MPKFIIGVTASISITVEALNEARAEDAARDYVESSLSPTSMEIQGWNDALGEDGPALTTIIDASSWSIDSSAVD